MQKVISGDLVQVTCASSLEDGTPVDTQSDRKNPIWIKAGEKRKLQSLGMAVIGMGVGEKKRVSVPPEQGFGGHDPELIFACEKAALPEDAAVGAFITMENEGQEMEAMIKGFEGDQAILDANHPYAGQTLVVDLKVLAIKK